MNNQMEPSAAYGLLKRDYRDEPVGTLVESVPGNQDEVKIPRSQWPERIAKIDAQKTSPYHHHLAANVPILNQTSQKYCWAYSVVAGVMNRVAFQGIDPVPRLSAAAVAAVGTGYRNVGGHCSKAAAMIQDQGGVPTDQVWPNTATKSHRHLADSKELKDSRKQNQLVQFYDLGNDIDLAISLLIGPTPLPVTFSLPWWRHAILGLEVLDCEKGNPESLDRYGIRFVNSYGKNWRGVGFGEIWGDKMYSWEHVAIDVIKPRSE